MKTLLTYIRANKLDPEGEPWNYEALSRNPHLTWSLMRENLDLPWNYSRNPNVTEEIIRAHPEIAWNFPALSRNHNLSIDFFLAQSKELYGEIDWWIVLQNGRFTFSPDWLTMMTTKIALPLSLALEYLSRNPNLQLTDISLVPQLKWQRWCLSENPNLTFEYILNPPRFLQGDWNWSWLTVHPNISYVQIKSHWGLPWNRSLIQDNPSITEADVIDLTDHSGKLVENSNISLAFIQANRQLNWKMLQLEENRSLHLEALLLPTTKGMGTWDWTVLLTHLRGRSYEAQLTILQMERQNPASYWSLLPPDMLQHYLGRYFD